MRPLRSLLIYLLAVFIGGALVAPGLFHLVQSAAPGSHLAHNPFHRYVNRSLLIIALAGIWPLLKSLGATRLRDAGLINPSGQWKQVGRGFALGFFSLAAIAAIAIFARARSFEANLGAQAWCEKILGAAGAAAGVSFIEELLFRGAVFGSLRKVWDWRAALVFSGMIYAIVHFMRSADAPGPVAWDSGLRLLPEMLAGFADVRAVMPGFFNLTLAGVMLGFAYQRTGNLYFSMGLHGGWIFWLKLYGSVTGELPGAQTWAWGTGKLVDGWLALAVLAATFFALAWMLKKEGNGAGDAIEK